MLFKNALIVVPNSEKRKSNVISFFFSPVYLYLDFHVCQYDFFLLHSYRELWHKKNRSWLQNSHVLKCRSSTFSEHGVLNFSIKLFLKIHFDRNKITSIKTQTTTSDSLCYKKKIRKAKNFTPSVLHRVCHAIQKYEPGIIMYLLRQQVYLERNNQQNLSPPRLSAVFLQPRFHFIICQECHISRMCHS